MTETWYVEYMKDSHAMRNRCGNMLDVNFVSDLQGFRSVYAFSEQDASEISSSANSRGWKQYKQYSDTLFIDTDKGEVGRDEISACLQSLGINYTCYFSGKKGYHFHIPIKPIYDINTAYSQLQWCIDIGLVDLEKPENSLADASIYRPMSVFRLPGTVHELTGKKKEWVSVYSYKIDAVLEILIVEPPESEFSEFEVDESQFERAMLMVIKNLNNCPISGKRHTLLWSMSENLKLAGLAFDTTLDLIHQVNQSWSDRKKTDEEVFRAVSQAYRIT